MKIIKCLFETEKQKIFSKALITCFTYLMPAALVSEFIKDASLTAKIFIFSITFACLVIGLISFPANERR